MCDDKKELDCAVCLQKCHHPTQLPCGHVFCFLCVKGVAIQSRKCAMCRAVIPPEYLDNPVLLQKISPHQANVEDPQLENQWYYQGRNGWWKYDERSNIELESAFKSGGSGGECTLLLAGALYRIDFRSMTQVRCSNQSRRRHVKRDTPLCPSKGIAGIKTEGTDTAEQTKTVHMSNMDSNQSIGGNIEIVADSGDEQIVQIAEPEIITVEDVSNEFERLNIINVQDPES